MQPTLSKKFKTQALLLSLLLMTIIGCVTIIESPRNDAILEGYLISGSSWPSFLQLKSEHLGKFSVSHAWHWDWQNLVDGDNMVIDEAENRYLFAFRQRRNLSVAGVRTDPEHGIQTTRYDLFTGEVEHFLLNNFLAIVGNGNSERRRIYALTKDLLLLQHNHDGYNLLEIFSIAENQSLQQYTLPYKDLQEFFPENRSRYLDIIYFDREEHYLLFRYMTRLYRLELSTMQASVIRGITTNFRTEHPYGYGGTTSAYSVKKHQLFGLYSTRVPTAIYHLPTMQMVRRLPATLPKGDYHLVDVDLLLVHSSYQTLLNMLESLDYMGLLGPSSTSELRLYRLTETDAELIWYQKKPQFSIHSLKPYYLPQLVLPANQPSLT
jgi:hypothetical protein